MLLYEAFMMQNEKGSGILRLETSVVLSRVYLTTDSRDGASMNNVCLTVRRNLYTLVELN
jgi:hypothetical protein